MNGTDYLLAVCLSLTVSMALIPLLVRAAPRLGLMDEPDPRKVHSDPIPRVGGLAIVSGGLIAMLLWLSPDQLMQSYLLAVLVLVGLGAWDDIREIGHYTKFTGQFIAALIVVLHGDLYITRLPFGWESVPPVVGMPFTVFAMVGMINAINHSDGLDGLAGGESLLSLIAIAYLAHAAGNAEAVIIAAALVGGILGFLRFNTFPARIFMGDAGSQVLGLTLGFLTVLLTQRINPALSAAIPALLLGLPIADILAVLYLRIRNGLNWFRASKNHIHHRLLGLGFAHHESVVAIYSVQALLILFALMLRYESDELVLGLYLAVVGAVFFGLTVAERSGWHAHDHRGTSLFFRTISGIRDDQRLATWPPAILRCLVPGFMVLASVAADALPYDMALVAGVLFIVALLDLYFGSPGTSMVVRSIVYVAVVFTVYLATVHPPAFMYDHYSWVAGFFAVVAVTIAVTLRFGMREAFELTPMDYLIVCAVIGVVIVGDERFLSTGAAAMAVQAVILVYGCEILLSRGRGRLTALNIATVISLGVISLRGLL